MPIRRNTIMALYIACPGDKFDDPRCKQGKVFKQKQSHLSKARAQIVIRQKNASRHEKEQLVCCNSR
jgi:hypothetical protein